MRCEEPNFPLFQRITPSALFYGLCSWLSSDRLHAAITRWLSPRSLRLWRGSGLVARCAVAREVPLASTMPGSAFNGASLRSAPALGGAPSGEGPRSPAGHCAVPRIVCEAAVPFRRAGRGRLQGPALHSLFYLSCRRLMMHLP